MARALGAAALLACVAPLTRCADPRAVRVVLRATAADGGDARRLAIHAQVIGPPAALRYRWFAVAGTCDPQETDEPTTVFRFAPAGMKDRVAVEVWRGAAQLTRSELDVRVDEQRERAAEPTPAVRVAITAIPPFDPDGGPQTHATIAGRVIGPLAQDYRIVLYARADAWYIQPTPAALQTIGADHTWASWTHTGSRYAALLVHASYEPPSTLNVLPQVGGDVLALTAVDGARP